MINKMINNLTNCNIILDGSTSIDEFFNASLLFNAFFKLSILDNFNMYLVNIRINFSKIYDRIMNMIPPTTLGKTSTIS